MAELQIMHLFTSATFSISINCRRLCPGEFAKSQAYYFQLFLLAAESLYFYYKASTFFFIAQLTVSKLAFLHDLNHPKSLSFSNSLRLNPIFAHRLALRSLEHTRLETGLYPHWNSIHSSNFYLAQTTS